MFKNDQNIRPDKILEERLLLLVFMLTATIVSIGFYLPIRHISVR